MSKQHVIVLVTDAGFAMPTMSVAMQILAQPDVVGIADVIVYLVGLSKPQHRLLEDGFADHPMRFVEVPPELVAVPEGIQFNRTHVPMTTLARLSLGELIPSQYEHVLYLDGDIQLLGDILPLVRHKVKEGRIASGNEALWMYEGDRGSYWQSTSSYIRGLGLQSPMEYFNAGVLAFRRSTWLTGGIAARDFYFQNSDLCLYHDQSALNATFRGKREILSPLYNFVGGYADLGLAAELRPRIVHFTGGAKPWNSRCRPWRGKFIPYYEAFVKKHQCMELFGSGKTAGEVASTDEDVERRWKLSMLRTPWRPALRRRMLRRYVTTTRFAV